MTKEFLIIIFSAILVDNFVLSKFMGICSFLGVSKNLKTAMGMSGAVVCVMLVASAITWPIQHLLLNPLKLGYLQTLVFILVIAALVQLVEIILKKYIPALHASLGIYLPLITTNCAVLGVTINNITDEYNFIQSMVSSLGCGLGFLLAMWIFAGIRNRLEESDAPECFKGMPITLVAASIVSVAFMGFGGIIDKLFA